MDHWQARCLKNFKSWKTERQSGAMVNLNRQREQFLCRQWMCLTKNQLNKLENWENPEDEDERCAALGACTTGPLPTCPLRRSGPVVFPVCPSDCSSQIVFNLVNATPSWSSVTNAFSRRLPRGIDHKLSLLGPRRLYVRAQWGGTLVLS